MQRGSTHAITGWMAVLLLPVALPLVFLASVWPGKKTVDRTPEEVAGLIDDFTDGTGSDWDWDNFESLSITDPTLDALRQEAIKVGPPYEDVERLRSIAARARAMTSA